MIRLLALLAVVGCAARGYEGETRPSAELARVETTIGVIENGRVRTASHGMLLGGENYSAFVVAVDGRALTRSRSVDVLPGPHEILVEWSRREVAYNIWRGLHRRKDREGRVRLALDARAGKRYRLMWGRIPAEGDVAPSMSFERVVEPPSP